MTELEQIRAAARQGLSLREAEGLLQRRLTDPERMEFDRWRALRKLEERRRIRERREAGPQSGADRVARHVARRADIGEIPPVGDPERRAAAEKSIVAFGRSYCRSLLVRPPSPRLEEYAGILQEAMETGGLVHVRLPRGAGKTTWIKIAIAWAVATGRLKYPVLFQASGALASAMLTDIWGVFEGGGEFGRDFPEIAHPIRCLDGLPQRCAGQTYHGMRTAIRRTASEIVLPTIDGSPSSGAIVAAKGAGQSVRGMVRGSLRPDFVLLDDISTRADAASDARTMKLSGWIQSDVMGLQGAKVLAGCMTSTPIIHGDLSTIYSDAARHPEFRLVEYHLVESWPKAAGLWSQYDGLWTRCQTEGDAAAARATEFYRAHRVEMDEGGDVLDPGAFDPRVELSAIQHARNLLLRAGKEAFAAEYQLRPETGGDVVACDAQTVMRALDGCARGTLPPGTRECLAFVDVMADRLHWAVCAFGPRQTAAVIDYGRYPERGRATPANAPDRDVETALARALVAVLDRLYGTDYRVAGSRKAVRPHAVWMDCGWKQRVVLRVAEVFRRRGFSNTLGCKGFAASVYGQAGRRVVATGTGTDLRDTEDGWRFAAQNSDLWREQVQKGFLGVPLQPGCLSLWGGDPAAHHEFAAQIAAERLADKAVSPRGVEMYRWTMKPGAQNHWLDATAGCLAMASWYRFWDSSDAVAKAAKASVSATPPKPRAAQRKRMRIRTARKP